MYFEIGTIVNTQGIKGEVRVMPSTFDNTRFQLLDEVEVVIRDISHILRIERVWYHKQFVILKFDGIDSMTAAEKLKTAVIRIPEEKALPLGLDEYYLRDLYGMTVLTETGEVLGELTSVIETGANDVYAVRYEDGEILIPAVKQCILDVNVSEKKMTVRLLKGMTPDRAKRLREGGIP